MTENNNLQASVKAIVDEHGYVNAEQITGINRGTLHHIIHNGIDSPKARRKLGVRKSSRSRLCIEAMPEQIADYDAWCSKRGLTRMELLQELVSNYWDKLAEASLD